MTNSKKRKKLLWGAMMLMNDIRRCKGWHEPLRSQFGSISRRCHSDERRRLLLVPIL